MIKLLDVSVLIALFDRDHIMSDRVAEWFSQNSAAGWATCAITENGFVRIVSQSSYPQSIQSREALTVLEKARAHSLHEFWDCDLSIADSSFMDPHYVLRSSQITDIYLLGLSVKHGGCFVTLDQRISIGSVPGATPANLLVL